MWVSCRGIAARRHAVSADLTNPLEIQCADVILQTATPGRDQRSCADDGRSREQNRGTENGAAGTVEGFPQVTGSVHARGSLRY